MTQFILRISISLFFAGISGGNLFAQAAEHDAVKQKIDSFFLAMTNADSIWMDSNLLPETVLTTVKGCLLYTSPSPRDRTRSRMPSSA